MAMVDLHASKGRITATQKPRTSGQFEIIPLAASGKESVFARASLKISGKDSGSSESIIAWSKLQFWVDKDPKRFLFKETANKKWIMTT